MSFTSFGRCIGVLLFSFGLFCGHSLVCRLNLDVNADSFSLSLFNQASCVIPYVSTYLVCLFFHRVHCCICVFAGDWNVIYMASVLRSRNTISMAGGESCGQTHGVVWSNRRISCSQEYKTELTRLIVLCLSMPDPPKIVTIRY